MLLDGKPGVQQESVSRRSAALGAKRADLTEAQQALWPKHGPRWVRRFEPEI
jgi:hypothetical protein